MWKRYEITAELVQVEVQSLMKSFARENTWELKSFREAKRNDLAPHPLFLSFLPVQDAINTTQSTLQHAHSITVL